MRFARDFNGNIVDAEKNKVHGNFICIECYNLAHWRKMSANQNRPHFYHKVANEECPLSVMGGEWDIQEDDQILFSSESGANVLLYPKKIEPNLSKIPSHLTVDLEADKIMPRSDMSIRLTSSDQAQLDFTVSSFCNYAKNQRIDIDYIDILAIPLPVKFEPNEQADPMSKRIHRRLVKILGSTPEFAEKLSFINIPDSVELSVNIIRKDL